jgi:MoxR-like ATPase
LRRNQGKTMMNEGTAAAASALSASSAVQDCAAVLRGVESVFRGKSETIALVLTAILARGHVLFEDVPGVGKTTLARVFARALGLSHRRIQFASDLMPADILGVAVFQQQSGEFVFKPGPIFCNILLADEINRTTPRTQSALLEAMAEGRATVDGVTRALPLPFVVLATQNPREFHGTYPLPESQLDRFLLRLSIGYPGQDDERALMQQHGAPLDLDGVPVVADAARLRALADEVHRVEIGPEVLAYMHALTLATRTSPQIELGMSTRAAIGYFAAVQARALVAGRDFATPDDVRDLFLPIAGHRVVARGRGGTVGDRSRVEAILCAIVESVPPPV